MIGSGLLHGQEPEGVAGLWVQRLVSTISWRGFAENKRGRFAEVLGGWIRGADTKAFSKDPFEAVEARIISSGEGKVMGVTGGAGGGVGVMESSG